jgi:hypothetical protein
MENGSGGFLTNLTFVGGNFGYGEICCIPAWLLFFFFSAMSPLTENLGHTSETSSLQVLIWHS